MKQFVTTVLRLSLVAGLLLGFAMPAHGAENGKGVQTNGIIEFYEETVPSSSEPEPSSEPE
ncbi:cell wall protein, partial [Enterococcus sp. BWR-S5]|nr:cell wall protein [Enterococcus sp. BWR-S5]MBL1227568.1 cell wall protein [Enterococcus sp. BWR-S5]